MFGCLGIEFGGARVDVSRRHSGAVLARLALNPGEEVTREALATMLWPEDEWEQARARLRQRLYVLANQIDELCGRPMGAIQASRETVRLDPQTVSTDLVDFHTALDSAEASSCPTERSKLLREAIELSSGGLLPGFYHECFALEQNRVADARWNAIRFLALEAEQAGDLEGALWMARELVAADELNEEAACLAMRVLGGLGRPAEVKRQFEALRAALASELGTEPVPGTLIARDEAIQACQSSSGHSSSLLSMGSAGPESPTPEVSLPAGAEAPALVLPPRAHASYQPWPRRAAAFTGLAAGLAVLGGLGLHFSSGTTAPQRPPEPAFRTASFDYSGGFGSRADYSVSYRQDYGKGFAGPKIEGNELHLLDSHIGEASAIWFKRPAPITAFQATFRFKVTNPPYNPGILADGFSFTVQNDGLEAVGGSGGSIGYAGIGPSVGLAIMFHRATNDQPLTHPTWEIAVGGHPPLETSALPLAIGNGDPYRAELNYDGAGLMSASMIDERTGARAHIERKARLASYLRSDRPDAWVGFTGATGMGFSDVRILGWKFDSGPRANLFVQRK